MTQESLFAVAKRIAAADGKVTPGDVLAVRRLVYEDGVISAAEAEGIYAIERARKTHCSEWSDFFVEALTDCVLNQQPPAGYLSDENASWVMSHVKRRKEPSTDGDLELVVNLIEKAAEVPAAFSAFALRLAKEAVVYGDGPDAKGRMHAHGRVTDADVAMLQRVLWGAGSEGLTAISHDEAEALFAIGDATTGADNVPEFDDLFARCIGNYLLGATGRHLPSREAALKWETEGADKLYKRDLVGVLWKAVRSGIPGPRSLAADLRNVGSLADDVELEHGMRNVARDVDIEFSSIVTPQKAQWLLERIGKNGVMNGPEKALVRFVAREASHLDPSLAAAIAKVA